MVIAVVIICGLSISAVAYDDSEENIWVYSQECPSAVEEYMEENYSRFLIAAIESDTIQVGEHICVGSPFAMSGKENVAYVYYFPVISDEMVVATFRIYFDNENDQYTGIMSKYLADELNQMKGRTSEETPALLFVDEGNIMATINTEILTLMPSVEGKTPNGIGLSCENMKIVPLLTPTKTISSAELVSPQAISKYIQLKITETQGQNEWCFAYASSAIIRTVTDETPQAEDIMRLFYTNPQASNFLNMLDVVQAGKHYGLNPSIKWGTMDPMEEIDGGRPVFLRCEQTSAGGKKTIMGLCYVGITTEQERILFGIHGIAIMN